MAPPETKLTREGLRAALDRTDRAVGQAAHEGRVFASVPAATLALMRTAARALLAATEPASDEELRAGIAPILAEPQVADARRGYRAAEARVRRLANWSDDKPTAALAAGAGGEGGEEVT